LGFLDKVFKFAPWKDSIGTNKFLFISILGLFLILLLTLSNVGQASPELAATILLFLVFSIIAFIGFLIAKISPGNKFVKFLGFGDNFNLFIIALVIGAAGAFFASGIGFSMSKFSQSIFDLAALTPFTILLIDKVAAPFGEEFIFAGFLQPTLGMHFGQIYGTLLNAAIFAGGHLLAYGGNPEQLLAAFAFRIIASVGNYAFNSIGFSLGAHFVFNLT